MGRWSGVIWLVLVVCAFVTASLASQAPSLIAFPTHIRSADTITFSWKNVQNPSDGDWIGVYGTYDNLVLAWIFANTSSTYQQGYGSVGMYLINMRMPYTAKYIRADSEVVVISNPITVDAEQPMQGHISLTDDPSQIRVMWVSNNTDTPTVKYGLSPDTLSFTSTGTSSTYSVEDMMKCQNGTYATTYFFHPGYIHDVLLTDLKPSTKYYYTFGGDGWWSNVMEFVSAADIHDDGPLRIIAYGDSGTPICNEDPQAWCQPGSLSTYDHIMNIMAKDQYHSIWHIGDIAYAVGFAARWEQFFSQIEPIATQLPYMVTIGNHEYDYPDQPFKPSWSNFGSDSGGECGVPFMSRFHMPGNRLWYSVDYPHLHVAFLSTEHDYTTGSEQYDWLQKDLANVNRTLTPFVIVAGHRAMYSSGNFTGDYIVGLHMRSNFEHLLYKYNVDVALWGHYHSYERTCAVYNAECQEQGGTIHVVIGMAGFGLDDYWMVKPDWSIFRVAKYGYTTIEVPDNHSLHFQYFLDSDGSVADEFWIRK